MSYNCSGCGDVIRDVSLDVFGMNWHPTCLCCNVCGKDFSDGNPVQEGPDGYAYCAKDYMETFSPKCSGCGQSIVGEVVNALGKQWHPDHFGCNTCKNKFTGQFFVGDDGNAYCEKHYYDALGLLCSDCDKPILTGKCVSFLDKKFHPEHFRCSYCKKNLVGQAYNKQNNKPYCKTCHLQLYG